MILWGRFFNTFSNKIDYKSQFRKKNNFKIITFISGETDIPNCGHS